MLYTIDEAEVMVRGERFLRAGIQPGDEVKDGDHVYTITAAALDCDCGKGAYCPLNAQRRVRF